MIARIRIHVPARTDRGAVLAVAALACVLCCGPLRSADDPRKGKDDEARREQQSKNLRRSAAQYMVFPADDPKRPFKFRESAGAPAPAETAAERLRQMKALAGKFSATYTNPSGTQPLDLRLLVQPVFRFEAGADPRGPDGAVFVFANGTNPMAVLLLETRQVGESRKWHYAFARTASGAVAARYDEKEVFSVKSYDFRTDPTQTFLLLPRQPLPKE